MADGDSLNEVNSDREIDANAADADIDDDEVIAARYGLCGYTLSRSAITASGPGGVPTKSVQSKSGHSKSVTISTKQSKAKMCNGRRHVPLCPACANEK